jgi:hypothetical protein
MIAWCWVVAVFGAVLATAGAPATEGVARAAFDLIGAREHGAGLFSGETMRFSVGLMGAVTLGWGLTVLAIVHEATSRIWRGVTAAFGVWYVVDSAISLANGYPLNALSNTLLLAGYLAPVLATGVLGAPRRATA